MARGISVGAFRNATDPEFRFWVAAIIAILDAGGWVNPGDAGQINTSTVNAPAAVSTFPGYVIRRTNDGMTNLFMRMDFGSASGAADRPAVKVQFGLGSDGAGNLTGVIFPQTTFAPNGAASGTAINANLCAGKGFFSIPFLAAVTSSNIVMILERTRDDTGALKNQWVFYAKSGATLSIRAFDSTRQYPSQTQGNIIQFASDSVYDGEVGLGKVLPGEKGFLPPMTSVLGVNNITAETSQLGAAQSTFDYEMYGQTRSYIVNWRNGLSSNAFDAVVAHFATRWQISNDDY